jgi:heptose-I-phosphate ethanolaminephosphotransferase
MGCYNSQHSTTPFQDNLRKQQGAIFFDRIYACHVQTTKAVPMIVTLYNQYIKKEKSKFSDAELSLSLLDIAKNNGYNVYWISNQEKISTYNSIITSIAASATQCIFMSDLNNQTSYDHEILPILQKINFSQRSLVIIHLMGNHSPYGLTFPRKMSFPDNLDPYEKSVYYNDKVMQQITEFFQTRGASLITYVSDHSDAVSIGKMHDPRPNEFHFEMIEIPMWIWTSREYCQKYPKINEKLHSISNKVITNDLVFNIYMDLMQFQHIDKIDKYSPLSDNYILDTEPPKTLDGKLEIPNP